MLAKPQGFALDHEGQAGVDGSQPGSLVLAQQARVLGGVPRRVELPPERGRVREGGLELLTGPSERACPFLGELVVDPPVRVLEPAHRTRATASA